MCVCVREREGEKYNRNVNYYRLKTNTFLVNFLQNISICNSQLTNCPTLCVT